MLDLWRFYIALLSLYSSCLGVFMAAYMLPLKGSPFEVHDTFEAIYLVIEISNYCDVILTFLTEYHDEDKDKYVRDI